MVPCWLAGLRLRRRDRTSAGTVQRSAMVSIASELAEKGSLGPAVPERVQCVDLPSEVGEPINKRLAAQPPQVLLVGEPDERVAGLGGDVSGRQNSCVWAIATVRSSPPTGRGRRRWRGGTLAGA